MEVILQDEYSSWSSFYPSDVKCTFGSLRKIKRSGKKQCYVTGTKLATEFSCYALPVTMHRTAWLGVDK